MKVKLKLPHLATRSFHFLTNGEQCARAHARGFLKIATHASESKRTRAHAHKYRPLQRNIAQVMQILLNCILVQRFAFTTSKHYVFGSPCVKKFIMYSFGFAWTLFLHFLVGYYRILAVVQLFFIFGPILR